MSLVSRLARLFREPTTQERASTRDTARYRSDGGGEKANAESDTAQGGETTAVAVVVQSLPEGVRRFELTVRAGTPVAAVEPGLLTRHFETFDDGVGVVRARAVDMDGKGRTVDAATPLFVVRFEEPVDPDAVALDGNLDGHDEEPVPWSRVRLTAID